MAVGLRPIVLHGLLAVLRSFPLGLLACVLKACSSKREMPARLQSQFSIP